MLLLIAKGLYFIRMIPQNYDEAYFLDVVQAMLEGKATPRYAPLFHPQITTGATVTLPMYWISQALEFSVARARLVIFAYRSVGQAITAIRLDS